VSATKCIIEIRNKRIWQVLFGQPKHLSVRIKGLSLSVNLRKFHKSSAAVKTVLFKSYSIAYMMLH